MKTSGYKVGISIFWGNGYNHFWSNGAGQNLYFMADVISRNPKVEEVYFVYWYNKLEDLSDALREEIAAMPFRLAHIDEVVEDIDVVIEGTLSIDQNIANQVHNHGGKVVCFRMGNDLSMDQEKFRYGAGNGRAFHGVYYDGIWMSPQLINSNKHYVEIMDRCLVQEAPLLWSPHFLDRQVAAYKNDPSKADYPGFGYNLEANRQKSKKRVSIHEVNISLLKSCYTPILISEHTYRENPELLEHVYVTSTWDKRELPVFHNFVGWMDIVRDNVLSVESRYITPYFMGMYSDVIVAHQWELDLNYIYFEVLYGNYPFVHNSPRLRKAGVGFYYDGYDAYDGSRALVEAITTYDDHYEEHVKANKRFLYTLSPENPINVAIYAGLLEDCIHGNNRLYQKK